jgi:hypothetical protein
MVHDLIPSFLALSVRASPEEKSSGSIAETTDYHSSLEATLLLETTVLQDIPVAWRCVRESFQSRRQSLLAEATTLKRTTTRLNLDRSGLVSIWIQAGHSLSLSLYLQHLTKEPVDFLERFQSRRPPLQ